ncbi:MAG: hypothetical protein L0219_16335 [Phycisphaerales bacterium]|nr:hypothetical protein [Phycisphaerales bacterium]
MKTPSMATDPTTHLPNVQVAAAFAKGMPLIENTHFKIHAGRRDKPGQAELHSNETDIFHVLEGAATFVTGGTIVDAKTTAIGEIRGPSIRGGTTRTLKKGDVIIVPAGTAHWFKDIAADKAMLYYVVKVATGTTP